jgi:hypothetical protein
MEVWQMTPDQGRDPSGLARRLGACIQATATAAQVLPPVRVLGRVRRSSGFLVASLLAALTVKLLLAPRAAWADPIEVNPSWESAPWQGTVERLLNVTAQTAFACCAFSLLAGGAAMGLGKIVGSYQAGHRGLQLMVGGGGGALVVASTASILSWLIGPGETTA